MSFNNVQDRLPISVGGVDYVERVVEVLAEAFKQSTFHAYLFRQPGTEPSWPSDSIPVELLRSHFGKFVGDYAKAGAELIEAGDWAGVALWFRPGIEAPHREGVDWRIQEYREVFGRIKKEHLRSRNHWYLNLIGRHPDRTEPSVARALIDPYLERARQDGVPVWLEASTKHARDVYTHLGFRTVAEAKLGVGKVNTNGELEEGGEGLVLYGMIVDSVA